MHVYQREAISLFNHRHWITVTCHLIAHAAECKGITHSTAS